MQQQKSRDGQDPSLDSSRLLLNLSKHTGTKQSYVSSNSISNDDEDENHESKSDMIDYENERTRSSSKKSAQFAKHKELLVSHLAKHTGTKHSYVRSDTDSDSKDSITTNSDIYSEEQELSQEMIGEGSPHEFNAPKKTSKLSSSVGNGIVSKESHSTGNFINSDSREEVKRQNPYVLEDDETEYHSTDERNSHPSGASQTLTGSKQTHDSRSSLGRTYGNGQSVTTNNLKLSKDASTLVDEISLQKSSRSRVPSANIKRDQSNSVGNDVSETDEPTEYQNTSKKSFCPSEDFGNKMIEDDENNAYQRITSKQRFRCRRVSDDEKRAEINEKDDLTNSLDKSQKVFYEDKKNSLKNSALSRVSSSDHRRSIDETKMESNTKPQDKEHNKDFDTPGNDTECMQRAMTYLTEKCRADFFASEEENLRKLQKCLQHQKEETPEELQKTREKGSHSEDESEKHIDNGLHKKESGQNKNDENEQKNCCELDIVSKKLDDILDVIKKTSEENNGNSLRNHNLPGVLNLFITILFLFVALIFLCVFMYALYYSTKTQNIHILKDGSDMGEREVDFPIYVEDEKYDKGRESPTTTSKKPTKKNKDKKESRHQKPSSQKLNKKHAEKQDIPEERGHWNKDDNPCFASKHCSSCNNRELSLCKEYIKERNCHEKNPRENEEMFKSCGKTSDDSTDTLNEKTNSKDQSNDIKSNEANIEIQMESNNEDSIKNSEVTGRSNTVQKTSSIPETQEVVHDKGSHNTNNLIKTIEEERKISFVKDKINLAEEKDKDTVIVKCVRKRP